MTRKKLMLSAALTASVLGGAAVTANALIERGPMRADTNGDGVVSRSEFFNAAEARFKARDANGDRRLTGDEMKDRRGRFARLDTNDDGTLSFAEQAAGTTARFSRLDADGDGKLTPEELAPRHGRRGGPVGFAPDGDRPGPGAMALQRLDTDGDGRITREEMRAQADQRFDRLDANRDGVIDQVELQAMRGRMAGGRRGDMVRSRMDDTPPAPPPAPDNQ